MTLNCCAADAQPVKTALTGNVPPVLRPDSWLEVTGTYTPRRTNDPVNDGPVPYVQVTASRPVPPPSEPYVDAWTGCDRLHRNRLTGPTAVSPETTSGVLPGDLRAA